MKEYIERDVAISAITALTFLKTAPEINDYVEKECHRQRGWIGGIRDALIEIGYIPAADVRPVVRGKWIKIEEVDDGGPLTAWLLERYNSYGCSVCGYKYFNMSANDDTHNYCPNCGADMREC